MRSLLILAVRGADMPPMLRVGYDYGLSCACHLAWQVDATGSRPHVFAAVIHSERTAHGGEHLRRNLYHETLQQLKTSSGGDPLAAIK